MDDLTRLAVAAAGSDRAALAALAAFVRKSQAEVWRLCNHLVDRQAADDLTQEVYLRALPALASFRAEASARTWLLAIARRTCADAVRRRVRRRALLGRLSSRPEVADPAGLVALDALVAGLDDDRRLAFVLTQVLGLSYEEASEVAECPVGTIRSRVARARADLVRVLEESEHGVV